MRIGFALPNGGSIATIEAAAEIAKRAEELDYSSLWTGDLSVGCGGRPLLGLLATDGPASC